MNDDPNQQQKQSKESQYLLQLVIDKIPQAIFWKDRNSVFLGCNSNFAADAGLEKPEDIIGKTDYDLPWTKEEADFYRECDKRVILSGVPELHIQETQQQADGKIIWLDTNKIPLLDTEGNIVGILGTYEDVTERKQVEERLRHLNEELENKVEERTKQLYQTEVRISQLFNNVPGVIYQFRMDVDGEMSFPYMSSGCRKIYEVEPEETDAKFLFSVVYPEYLPQLQETIINSAKTLDKWEFEWRIKTKSGKKKWLKGNSQPQRQPDGSTVWDGYMIDFTEHKQAEETLLEQEEFLRSVYDGVEHLIFVVNVLETGEFRFAGWNLPTERATGCSRQDVVDKSPLEVFGDIQGQDIHQRYDNCVKAGKAITYEECRNFDGNDTWWLTTLNPLKDDRGRIYRLVGTTFDITAGKQAELALKEQMRLSAFRAAINSVLVTNDSLQDILQHCTQVVVEYLDAAFARIWIFNPQENILELQASAGMYTHIDGSHGRIPVGKYKIGLIAQERKPHLTNSVQTDPRVSDKEWAKKEGMIAFAGYPLIVSDQLVGVIAMFSRQELSPSVLQELSFVANEMSLGISRKQATEEIEKKAANLKQTLEELQSTQAQLVQTEKMSSLGQMVAGIAHEINNPVNFIHGNLNPAREYTQDLLRILELYEEYYPNPPEEIVEEMEAIEIDFLKEDLLKILTSMKGGTQRIREIVLSLRNFSRLDEAEFKDVNIHEGIESTLMILHHRLKANPNSSEVEIIKKYDELPLIECYPGQINQVLMNILVNAIDVVEMLDNPCICISTKLIEDNWVEISIKDNGSGIDKDNLNKLFDPFFTTKEVGKGTGLGLSISYQIVVDKHGGKLFCESSIGNGTEFVIQLPIFQS